MLSFGAYKNQENSMKNQFQTWEQDVFDKDAFVEPEVVVKKVKSLLK